MQNIPQAVYQKMMSTDYYNQWLGIKSLEHREGFCKIEMTVRREMLNGFGIVHGGVSFGFADSALAFAANSYNILSVTLNGFVTYPNPAKEGDTLTAEANETSNNRKTATYDVTIYNQKQEKICLYRATIYRTKRTVISQ